MRSIKNNIVKDLKDKLVLLSGPRQVGKTTLATSLYNQEAYYLNYDEDELRKIIDQKAWPRDRRLIILDELHKKKNWKRWLKGIYDSEGVSPQIIVTGSAKMDTFRKGGDSLAGRHFYYRLHPFSPAELREQFSPQETLSRIIHVGGFPEPFLKNDQEFANRWRKSHLDRIIREDLLDLQNIREIKSIEILVSLLAERVGSIISYQSLAEDLQVSPTTVKRWVEVLESLYVIFVVTPYSKNIPRGLIKAPKIYFYDTGRVVNESGARLENAVACALLKRNHFLEDTKGSTCSLHYIRDLQKNEVDFLVIKNKCLEFLIEVKTSQVETRQLQKFSALIEKSKNKLETPLSILLVGDLKNEMDFGEIKVRSAADWLAALES